MAACMADAPWPDVAAWRWRNGVALSAKAGGSRWRLAAKRGAAMWRVAGRAGGRQWLGCPWADRRGMARGSPSQPSPCGGSNETLCLAGETGGRWLCGDPYVGYISAISAPLSIEESLSAVGVSWIWVRVIRYSYGTPL